MPAPDPLAAPVVQAYLTSLDVAGASRSLRRQRSWALREALLFAAAQHALGGSPAGPLDDAALALARAAVPRVRLSELVADAAVGAWTGGADALLRGVTTSSPATVRARAASVRALAAFAAAEVPAHRAGAPALREVLPPPHVEEVLRVLAEPLPGRGPDDHVRLAAVLAVMSAWPARSAELSALTLDRVQVRGPQVRLAVGADAVVLHGLAAERFAAWLDVRSGIVGALEGGPMRALWVSIRTNRRPGPRGSTPLPPGMPLRPRGLQRAYARSVEAANAVHGGRPGFPVPRSLDLLRRSLLPPSHP